MSRPLVALVVTPVEALRLARTRALELAAEIRRLNTTPLAHAETIDDRARDVAVRGAELAETFLFIDTVLCMWDPASPTSTDSPASASQVRPGSQGCATEEDPTAN